MSTRYYVMKKYTGYNDGQEIRGLNTASQEAAESYFNKSLRTHEKYLKQGSPVTLTSMEIREVDTQSKKYTVIQTWTTEQEQPAPSNEKKTCQVCGRAIKAPKGLIAHHGYQRPGYGWIEGTCKGSKYVPYEVSCERLKEVTERVASYLARQEREQKDFLENPPATLTRDEKRGTWGKADIRTYTKPENFDPNRYCGRMFTYENAYASIKSDYIMHIKMLTREVEIMRARIAAWKPAE